MAETNDAGNVMADRRERKDGVYERIKNGMACIGTGFSVLLAVLVGFLVGKGRGKRRPDGGGVDGTADVRGAAESCERTAEQAHQGFRDIVERVEKRRKGGSD